ncbi:hypothetical protein GCM10010517_46190 [Streptosporangium fragile]|uniref:Uncharacterized protein n=1 Tax=Streptosporangium fragile TaxID=46186 RepID=A0ABN3W1K4_9ACTN
MLLAVSALAGCTPSGTTQSAEARTEATGTAAEPSKAAVTPSPAKSSQASVFGPPFPKKIEILDLVSSGTPEYTIPNGPHHTFLGEQSGASYRNQKALHTLNALGGQARVSDAKAAVTWLTKQPGSEDWKWTDIDPGPLGGAAACITRDGGTWCYWADADTVGLLTSASISTEGMKESFVTIRNALEKKQ